MELEKTANMTYEDTGRSERFFTVDSANSALVLVRPIVQEIVSAYAELMRLRGEQQDLALAADSHARLDEVREHSGDMVERLKKLNRELTDIGCELKDLASGLVDFPALYDGRKVWLCWKLGESEVAHWHALEAGFAGRQSIDAKFRLQTGEPTPVGGD